MTVKDEKKRKESREGNELIRSRRRTLNIRRRWRSGVLKEQCLWPVLAGGGVSLGLGGALAETAVQMGALGKLGSGYHDGHPRDSLPTQARL